MNSMNDSSEAYTKNTGLIVGLTIAYVIVGLVALIGNTLVLYLLYAKPKTRSSIGFMFTNMAVADLLVAVFIVPWSLYELHTGGRWFGGFGGDALCKLLYYVFYTSIGASISTQTFMAMDRFLAIVFPMKFIRVFRKAKVVMPVIWMSAGILMIPLLVVAKYYRGVCMTVWGLFGKDNIDLSLQVFKTIIFIVLYAGPLLVMIVVYSIISLKLWLYRPPGVKTDRNVEYAERIKRKVVIMLMIIVMVFALCWLPTQTMHLLYAYDWELYQGLSEATIAISFIIGQGNSAINPCLYLTLNTAFRGAFMEILMKLLRPQKQNTLLAAKETAKTATGPMLKDALKTGTDNAANEETAL